MVRLEIKKNRTGKTSEGYNEYAKYDYEMYNYMKL